MQPIILSPKNLKSYIIIRCRLLKTDTFFTNRYITINPQESFAGVVGALCCVAQHVQHSEITFQIV